LRRGAAPNPHNICRAEDRFSNFGISVANGIYSVGAIDGQLVLGRFSNHAGRSRRDRQPHPDTGVGIMLEETSLPYEPHRSTSRRTKATSTRF